MARSPLMRLVQRIARDARAGMREGHERGAVDVSASRRAFVKRTLAIASAAAMPVGAWAAAPRAVVAPKVVVVGAGLAGLSAAYDLRKAGVIAEIYEASPRAGGRCWSERRAFD